MNIKSVPPTTRRAFTWYRCIALVSIVVCPNDAHAAPPSPSIAHDIVARATVQRLSPQARAVYEPNLKLIIEIAASGEAGSTPARLPDDAHHLMLDVDAETTAAGARLLAAIRFPRDRAAAMQLFNRHRRRHGGSLPWVMEEQFNLLVRALKAKDVERITRTAGAVIQLATDAALPFNTTVVPEGPVRNRFQMPPESTALGLAECGTARGRIQDWIVERARGTLEARLAASPCPPGDIKSVVEAAFTVMIDAAASLDAVLAVDTELVSRWQVDDGATFLAIERTFLAELGGRCVPIMASRLDAGVCLAAGLLEHAVESARVGADAAVIGPASERHQATRLVGSKNSKKFHLATCRHAKAIKPENLVTFDGVKEATQAGRQPCAVCAPGVNIPSEPRRR